ncbi:lytic transglycosylase [hydrothermal vent metagenome]|uniref:Lytic transglycosylase n=1 Tax=hydrothermal vent metagenome TaxID=652676 RepID=A0A1W1EFF9_9ZZZZ
MFKNILLTMLTGFFLFSSVSFAKDVDLKPIEKLESNAKQVKPLIQRVLKKNTSDLDEMLKKQTIRVLVVKSKAFYDVQKGRGHGLYHDAIVSLEKQINKNYPNKNKHIRTKLITVPVSRDALIPALNAGYGDLALADNTITKRRKRQIQFTTPFASGIKEILVTNKSLGNIKAYEDLSGKKIYVKASGSHMDSLINVNETLVLKGYEPMFIEAIPEELESEDILELVDSGLIEMTIMDDYKAKLWSSVYKNLQLHTDITFREDSQLAIMLRKDNPLLLKELNIFVEKHKYDTSFGRSMVKKYYSTTRYLKEIKTGISKKKFVKLQNTFSKYAKRYKLDPLMLMAQAYQESKFIQNSKSHVGAKGVMQLMPATAREMNVGSINNLDSNIHAGVKYHKLLKDRYFNDSKIDNVNRALFIFAGYNAGPNKINRLRKIAKEKGLNPNEWFGNVEIIAAEKIGRETVQYIENIYNYYVAYTLINIEEEAKLRAKIAMFYDNENKDDSKLSKREKKIRKELAYLTSNRKKS